MCISVRPSTQMMHAPRRRGFALLAVLWVMVGLAALALAARLAARDALAAATYRVTATAARWRAEGCAERARAVIDAALGRREAEETVPGAWAALDDVLASSSTVTLPLRGAACDIELTPAGVALDVNSADADMLRRLVRALGAGARAESITDAILDWRDADDVPRPLGAEREWYSSRGRYPPRDGPIAARAELARIRGVRDTLDEGADADDRFAEGLAAALARALTVEPGRVVLARAPSAVMLALPGMTEESVARVLDLRARGERVVDLGRLGSLLSPSARDTLLSHFPELSRAVTPEPDAWILVARAAGHETLHGSGAELRLVRAGSRAAIVRRRTW